MKSIFTYHYKYVAPLLVTALLNSNIVFATCKYESPPAQPTGELVTEFSVLTTNIYGQHSTASDGYCQDRIRNIGDRIINPPNDYDIVGVQEWHPDYFYVSCNGGVFENRIDDKYSNDISAWSVGDAPQGQSWSRYNWGQPESAGQYHGGLGIISKTPYLWENYSENDFRQASFSKPVETLNVHQFTPELKPRTAFGFVYARISLNSGIAIDTYVVHLTATGEGGIFSPKCNLQCKRGMLEQLKDGIHERSANSGFPVLIMGDFNIGGPSQSGESEECNGNDGYNDIMIQLGNPKDLWLEAHPSSAGATHQWFTDKPKRLDYMFVPSDPYLVNSDYEIVIKSSIKDNFNIVDWYGNSDHHGLEALLEVRKKLSWGALVSTIF